MAEKNIFFSSSPESQGAHKYSRQQFMGLAEHFGAGIRFDCSNIIFEDLLN